MVRLIVSVSGRLEESRTLTLPVDIYAPDGTVLANGTSSPSRPAYFEFPTSSSQDLDRIHVLSKLPNGETLYETAELRGGQGEVTLRVAEESPHEWLEWVTPFRSLGHLGNNIAPSGVALRRIGKVWTTLWVLRGGRWHAQGLQPVKRQQDNGMQQFVIDVLKDPHLLQVGGEEVAWRLISLPPGGPVRVALTRSPTEGGDSVEITVGRAKPDNELIMSYLARGAITEADRLAEAWDAADLMLYEKKRDPISAAAGAYFLLKNRRLQIRADWIDNLVKSYPYLADGAIVSAALALQHEGVNDAEIREKLAIALDRGLPVFAMGATVMVETMAAIHRGHRETKRFHAAYLAAQAYARACCSNGAYFEFYGKSPAEPTWTPIYGLEDQPSTSQASASPAEIVVSARPQGGIRTGRFGNTRVPLPRAPVSAEVVKELRLKMHRPIAKQLISDAVKMAPIFSRTLDRGIPVIEAIFPGEVLKGSHQVVSAPAAESAPQTISVIEHEQKAPSRQVRSRTAKFWRDERLKHSMTVFDGDD